MLCCRHDDIHVVERGIAELFDPCVGVLDARSRVPATGRYSRAQETGGSASRCAPQNGRGRRRADAGRPTTLETAGGFVPRRRTRRRVRRPCPGRCGSPESSPLLRDPDDDYLVAIARAARAAVIVTGDRDLLDNVGLEPPACTSLALPLRRVDERAWRRTGPWIFSRGGLAEQGAA